jgi:ribosomal-protein-alanine N-acetyltransferase
MSADPAVPAAGGRSGPLPRVLGEGDLQACLHLDRLALGGLWSLEQWQRELGEPARPCLGIGGPELLLAAATGWLILDEVHVTAVAVHPAHRRLGLGRRVLEALLERGRVLGGARATLEVAEGNTAARALYAALGFRTAGRRRGYYRSGEDALIQWRELRAEPPSAGCDGSDCRPSMMRKTEGFPG